MKIKLSTLVNTHVGFPSDWECESEEGQKVKLSYRYGRIKIFVDEQQKDTIDGPQGGFDVGGSFKDKSELLAVLEREDMVLSEESTSEED